MTAPETKTPPEGGVFVWSSKRGESAAAQSLLQHRQDALHRFLIALHIHHAATTGSCDVYRDGPRDVPGFAMAVVEQAMDETALLLRLRGDHAVHRHLIGHRVVVARADRAHATTLEGEADAPIGAG